MHPVEARIEPANPTAQRLKPASSRRSTARFAAWTLVALLTSAMTVVAAPAEAALARDGSALSQQWEGQRRPEASRSRADGRRADVPRVEPATASFSGLPLLLWPVGLTAVALWLTITVDGWRKRQRTRLTRTATRPDAADPQPPPRDCEGVSALNIIAAQQRIESMATSLKDASAKTGQLAQARGGLDPRLQALATDLQRLAVSTEGAARALARLGAAQTPKTGDSTAHLRGSPVRAATEER